MRAIGRWGFIAVVINSVVGSGVFGLPSALAGFAGAWSPLTVLIAGAGVFLVVLCLAEVAGRFDETGGPYLFAREAFGGAIGFEIGWLHTCARLLSAAAVLNVLVAYVSPIVPWTETFVGRAAVMTLAMASATYVNVIGVKQGSRTVSLFTVAKLLPLIALILLGLWRFDPDVLATQAVAHRSWTDAVLLLIFGYGGFETAVIPAGEVQSPKRDTPFALIFSLFAIVALYSLVQLVVVGVLPDAKDSGAPVAAALRLLIGPVGVVAASAAVVVSIYGWIVGSVLTMPRLLFAMSVRGEMPRAFATIHQRYRTPHVAIIVSSILSLAIGLAGGFQQMATFSAICRLAIFGVSCGAMIQLRRSRGFPVGYAAPGGIATAVAAIIFCLWLLTTRDMSQAWVLPLILLIGWVIWTTRSRSAVSDVSN
ncbi:MAG TPA: amino acid permease [Gemmatimonadaceae bacterium]|nr:amino acid permease [Gemmatimonadaceae bacterium]